ncbi:MAG: type II toxin-antitoxin system HicA family toxin [Chlamydiota bacterium]
MSISYQSSSSCTPIHYQQGHLLGESETNDDSETASSPRDETVVLTVKIDEADELVEFLDSLNVKDEPDQQADEKIQLIEGYWGEYVKNHNSENHLSIKEILAANDSDSPNMTFFTGIHLMALRFRHELYITLQKAFLGKDKDFFIERYAKIFNRLSLIAHLLVEYRSIVFSEESLRLLISKSNHPSEKRRLVSYLSDEISIIKKTLDSIQNKLKSTYKKDEKRLINALKTSSKLIDLLDFVQLLSEKQLLDFIYTKSKSILNARSDYKIRVPKTFTEYKDLSQSMLSQLSDHIDEFIFFEKKDPNFESKIRYYENVMQSISLLKNEFKSCQKKPKISDLMELDKKIEENTAISVHELVLKIVFTPSTLLRGDLQEILKTYGIDKQNDLANRLYYCELIKDYTLRVRAEIKMGMKVLADEKEDKVDFAELDTLLRRSSEYSEHNFHMLGFIDKIKVFSGDMNIFSFSKNIYANLHEMYRGNSIWLKAVSKCSTSGFLIDLSDCLVPLVNISSCLSFYILSSGSGIVNTLLKLRKSARRIYNRGLEPEEVEQLKKKHQVLLKLKTGFPNEKLIDCEFREAEGLFTTNIFGKDLFTTFKKIHEPLLENPEFKQANDTKFERTFWRYVNDNELWSVEDIQALLDIVIDMQLEALDLFNSIKDFLSHPNETDFMREDKQPVAEFTAFSSGTPIMTLQSLQEVLGVDKFFLLDLIEEDGETNVVEEELVEITEEPSSKANYTQEEEVRNEVDMDEVPKSYWKPEKWYKLRNVLKSLRSKGYQPLSSKRGRGSHMMFKDQSGNVVTVPRNLNKKGTVNSIIKV